MIFATFFTTSTGYVAGSNPPRFDGPKRPIEACGSDSILIIDGRYGDQRRAYEARKVCKARGFIGFRIEAGPRFSDSRIVRPLEVLA